MAGGHNLENNSLERFHLSLKSTCMQQKKLKLSEFIVKSIKIVRDYSAVQHVNFSNLRAPTTEEGRHAIFYLNGRKESPIYNILEGTAVFIKNK